LLENTMTLDHLDRRALLRAAGAGLAGLVAGRAFAADEKPAPAEKGKPTQFQIACMTLPYSAFPFERALTGLKAVGYKYVAWGQTHQEASGKKEPALAGDAPPEKAKEAAKKCRDLGLEPLMMFGPSPDNLAALKHRVRQAGAAGIPQVLTFGHTRGNDRSIWIKNFKELGPIARDLNVLIVLKQHGGNTGTGAVCAEITREVNDDGVRVNYDAGNVMDYLHIDPIPDIKKCADQVRSFCIKDHRMFPKDQDCGPGLGEIDHYKLLHPVAFTGRTMPLCCENIFAPALPRPDKPEGVDELARRAKEFLELVIQGLQVQTDKK
jgi:sugar phosphate isomerase/epimerase